MKPANLPLFRQEALDHKRDTWLGEILLARPTSFAFLTLFFITIAITALVYLVMGEYTKKARVSGYLVPDQGLIKIFAQQSGTVTKLAAKEGQNVKKGDVLLVVSTERRGSQGSTQLEVAKQLALRQKSLQDEKLKIEQIYTEQIKSASRRLDQLGKEQQQLESGIKGQANVWLWPKPWSSATPSCLKKNTCLN